MSSKRVSKKISESQLIRLIVDNIHSMDNPELLVDIYNQHLAGEGERIKYVGREGGERIEYVGREGVLWQRVYEHVNFRTEYDYKDPITV